MNDTKLEEAKILSKLCLASRCRHFPVIVKSTRPTLQTKDERKQQKAETRNDTGRDTLCEQHPSD